jgi:hypothetical protein
LARVNNACDHGRLTRKTKDTHNKQICPID